MCEWGTDREIILGRRRVAVDACIAATVLAVNAKGIRTTGSCCGHGSEPATVTIHPEDQPVAELLGYKVYSNPGGHPIMEIGT